MNTQRNSTALLLFVRDEQEEARCKPLAGSRRASAALFRRLNLHAIQQARRTGLPLFVVKGHQQRGDSFGERLSYAFASVFRQGYQRVISIGNDCPQLTAAQILKSAEALQRQPMVLGAAEDGGVYLLGLQQSAFRPQQFEQLPWQTTRLFEALQGYTAHYVLPKVCADIDDRAALRRAASRLPGNPWRWLQSILRTADPATATPALSSQLFFTATVSLRAPPC